MEDRFGRRVRVRGGDGSPPDRAGGVRPYVPSNLKPRVARHTPGSPAGDKENGGSPGHTSWAGQLWKHYDPINKIIFPGVGAKPTYDDRGKPFVGELQVRDVVYKTIIVHLPVLVPGGLCAPPVRIECPCLVVLRADSSARAKRCRGKGVIVYLHGNGTDIGGTAEEAKTLARELDCHVIVPEYPGYGLAEGVAGEDTVDATTHAAIRFACETMGAPLSRLILYGRSVGTGPAAAAAARLSRNYSHHGDHGDRGGRSSSGGSSGSSSASFAFAPGGFLGGPPAALILHSPYTSIYDYAKEKAGGLLSYLLVSERWPTRTNLRKIRCPTLLIHGDRDEVIPFRHSARLRRDAGKFPAPCQLHVQKGASHNAFDFFGDVADPIASFLRRHEKAPWGAKGEPAEAMELNLRDIERRVLEAGPGEMEDYPFADVPGK